MLHSVQKQAFRLISSVLLCLPPLAAADVYRLVDPVAIPAEGDPAAAVVTATRPAKVNRQSCDIVIAGGGMGGASAALTAAHSGLRVCLTEVTGWLGGQMTSQGVSALDENRWIETTGATRSYQNLRSRIRAHYLPQVPAGQRSAKFNPGGCWVSYLCFEPKVGLTALEEMLAPFRKNGTLRVMMRTTPVDAVRQGGRLKSLVVYNFSERLFTELTAKVFIDATELGDVLPLAGAGFRVGAESKDTTGEPDAADTADPEALQSFTYPFVLSTGSRPDLPFKQQPGYEEARSQYGFDVNYGPGNVLSYGMLEKRPKTPGSFWDYRRLVAKDRFVPGAFSSDLAMINWSGNDVCDPRYLSSDPLDVARALQHGKQVSLGFAWWLRHEAPRDDRTGKGFEQLVLRSDMLGSEDGLSLYPYIRESRRMESLRIVREQDVAAPWNPGARARHFDDTAGIGFYPIDIHGCKRGKPLPRSKPYQVPFGALISRDVPNLLAGAKNIGVTHIVNGAYRLHPVEWAIGEASGAVAVWAVKNRRQPSELGSNPKALLGIQRQLLAAGHPLIWFDDVLPDSQAFEAIQYAALTGLMPADPDSLHFRPEDPVTGAEAAGAIRKMFQSAGISRPVPEGLETSAKVEWSMLAPLGLTKDRNSFAARAEFAQWLLSWLDARKK